MPFMYRGKPANIDRSKRRKSDDCIYKSMLTALFGVGHPSFEAKYVKILPINPDDPKFIDADSKGFLTTYAIKLGLTWFEVEYWLDEISRIDPYKFQFEAGSLCDVDERRRYYERENRRGIPITHMITNSIIFRP